MVMVDGNSRRRYLRVTLDYMPNQYPFCDTMLWYARYDGVIGNSKTALRGYDGLVKLRGTRGNYTY